LNLLKIFISAAIFTYAEKEFNRRLRDVLVDAGYEVIFPQEFSDTADEEGLFM